MLSFYVSGKSTDCSGKGILVKIRIDRGHNFSQVSAILDQKARMPIFRRMAEMHQNIDSLASLKRRIQYKDTKIQRIESRPTDSLEISQAYPPPC